MTKYGLLVAFCAILTAASVSCNLIFSFSFWVQSGSHSPLLFFSLTALSFFAPVGFGYFMAKDDVYTK